MANDISNDGSNSGIMVAVNRGTITHITQDACKKLPSSIIRIVEILASVPISEDDNGITDTTPFKTLEKIEYNKVIKYKDIIKEYSIFSGYCEDALTKYDNSNIGAKGKILRCIKTWYLEIRGQLLLDSRDKGLSEIEIIRHNSDLIIDMVKEKISNLWKQNEFCPDPYFEEIEFGIYCFTCYCFMECKILEKPK